MRFYWNKRNGRLKNASLNFFLFILRKAVLNDIPVFLEIILLNPTSLFFVNSKILLQKKIRHNSSQQSALCIFFQWNNIQTKKFLIFVNNSLR